MGIVVGLPLRFSKLPPLLGCLIIMTFLRVISGCLIKRTHIFRGTKAAPIRSRNFFSRRPTWHHLRKSESPVCYELKYTANKSSQKG